MIHSSIRPYNVSAINYHRFIVVVRCVRDQLSSVCCRRTTCPRSIIIGLQWPHGVSAINYYKSTFPPPQSVRDKRMQQWTVHKLYVYLVFIERNSAIFPYASKGDAISSDDRCPSEPTHVFQNNATPKQLQWKKMYDTKKCRNVPLGRDDKVEFSTKFSWGPGNFGSIILFKLNKSLKNEESRDVLLLTDTIGGWKLWGSRGISYNS